MIRCRERKGELEGTYWKVVVPDMLASSDNTNLFSTHIHG